MNTPHVLALIIVTIGLVLLLIQTARAGYFRAAYLVEGDRVKCIAEEIRDTRLQRDAAQRRVLELQEHLQRLHERALLATSEPELFNELREANDVLRSVAGIVAREGQDVNWDGLGDRISERLERQHAMLFTVPDKR